MCREGCMKRVSGFCAIAFVLLAQIFGSAQGPVTVPLTEWSIPFHAGNPTLNQAGLSIDTHGNVWFANDGRFIRRLDADPGELTSPAIGRLVPGTGGFTLWP